MSVWVLEGYDTELREVRHREYTTSKKKAERFNEIPRIQFTDSGHGIVFNANPHSGKRKPARDDLWNHVQKHMVLAP